MGDRRERILILLRTRDFGLPEPLRRYQSPPGFVEGRDERGNPLRWLSCPDCLTNGKPMPGCETCGGRGKLPDLGPDPYRQTKVQPFGFDPTQHDRRLNTARQIASLDQQLAPPPKSELDAIAEANKHPYEWERERKKLYRNGDYARLDAALEALRRQHIDAYHVLHAVYVYGYHTDPAPAMQRVADLGLAFIDERMERRDEEGKLRPIRVPARFLPTTDAQAEQIRRRTEKSRAA